MTNGAVKQAQNTMKSMADQIREDSAAFIAEHHAAIVGVYQNAKIPEEVFRHHFLPHFSGKPDENPKRNVVAEWIGVAGTAMSRVDVTNEKGETLFTVPPIMDSNIIDLNKVGGKRLGDLLGEYNLHRLNGLRGADQRYMNNTIQPHLNSITTGESGADVAQSEWSKVFGYYGLGAGGKTNESKKDEDDGSSDLEY